MANSPRLPFKKSYAFIIGINGYQHVSKLRTARQDAESLAEILRQIHHGYEVYTCYDPGRDQMLAFFEKMKSTIQGKKDRLIFYFAGHGIAYDSDEDRPEGYLVPVDAKPGKVDSLVPMQKLYELLIDLPCHHGLIILDCCFAGAFQWSTTRSSGVVRKFGQVLYSERFLRFVESPAWQVLTSSAHDQKAADVFNQSALGFRGEEDSEAAIHSPFAWALLEGIRENSKADLTSAKARDGVITGTELYLYIRDKVETQSRSGIKRQSPGLFTISKKHDLRGEFIFIDKDHPLNFPKAPDQNPYRGLSPYQANDADVFCGRDDEIIELASKLKKTPFLIVSGPTASGKTSIIRAGLFHWLEENSEENVITVEIRPKNHLGRNWSMLSDSNIPPNNLFFIDPYEEIYLEAEEQRRSIENKLKNLVTRALSSENSQTKIIACIRSDHEWQFLQSRLGQFLLEQFTIDQFLYRLPTLSEKSLRQIIVQPAWQIAYSFEPESLINRILSEIKDAPGTLPLLSITLHKLYEKASQKGERSFAEADYEDFGGVNGALQAHADSVYNQLKDKGETYCEVMKKLMLRMVRLDGNAYERRRIYVSNKNPHKVFINELDYPDSQQEVVEEVLNYLTEESKLLVKNDDQTGTYYEPMHDALINYWPSCLKWIKAFGVENLNLQRDLWKAVKEVSQPRDAKEQALGDFSPYWDKNFKLYQVLDMVSQSAKRLFKEKRDFLKTEAQKWLPPDRLSSFDQFWRTFILEVDEMSEIDSLIVTGFSEDLLNLYLKFGNHWLNQAEISFIQESWKRRTASVIQLKKEKEEALSLALAAQARSFANRNPTVAVNLAFAALSIQKIPESVAAFHDITSKQGAWYYQLCLRAHKQAVNAIAFSPDGNRFVSGGYDHYVRLWDKGGKRLKQFLHAGAVMAVAFSPDGTSVLTGSMDKTSILWDLSSDNQIIFDHHSPVRSVTFTGDGQYCLTGDEQNMIRVWDLEGNELVPFKGHKGWILSLASSSDGKYVISGSSDNTVRLWDFASRKKIWSRKHPSSVESVAISRDGQFIASSDQSNQFLIRTIKGLKVQSLIGHENRIFSVCFSNDSKKVLSGSWDFSVREWNLEGEELNCLNGHTDKVFAVAYSSNGKEILSAGADSTIRLWNPIESKMCDYVETDSVFEAIIESPDKKWILKIKEDYTAFLENKDGEKVFVIPDDLKTRSAAFSPDSRYFLTIDRQIVILWDIHGNRLFSLYEMSPPIKYAKFSSDGSCIITEHLKNICKQWHNPLSGWNPLIYKLDKQEREMYRIEGEY